MNAKAIALGIVGILLFSMNLFVVSPFVMGVVDEKLSEATVMTNDTWEDEEWLNAVSTRSFYAWNLTNVDELQENDSAEMQFEKMGPITYELTTKREVLYHDSTAGTLTYREYNVYEWSGGMSGDSQLTNINILFNTQKIGAAGSAIDFGSLFVKGAFARDMMYVDMSERAPSIWVSDDIATAGEEAMMTEVGWGGSEIANTTLHHVLYDAKDSGDDTICIALTCDIGPMLMVRLGVPDSGPNSIARATMFGYVGIDDNETFERDYAIYNTINARFTAHGGGANLESASHDDLNDRLEEMTGVRVDDEPTLDNLLFGEVDGTLVGLLRCDSQKILCGSTYFLQGAQDDPFATLNEYTMNESSRFGYTELVGIGLDWAGAWFLADTDFEMVLAGASGKMNADEWFLEAFGSIDPINHEYITLSLNVGTDLGPLWSTVYGNELIDLDPAVTAGLFTGPHSIIDSFAQDFLYGEIMGYSVPMDEDFIPAAGGTVHEWNDSLVAQIYGLDNNSASALRWLFSYTVFDQFLEPLLENFLDVVPYKTQSVNQWLFGWEDPLSGWASLEKNATYFGCVDSNNLGVDGPCSTNSASIYSVYTGEVGNHEPGQIIAEDGDIHLPWRTPSRNASAYGLLDPVVQSGAVGSYFPANLPATANLGGYAVATSEVSSERGSVYGIETYTHTFTVNPLENPIQAKLLAQENVLDIFPGALPIYFGGTVVMQMEPNVDAAIAGEMTSYFYLDTRGIGAIDPTIDDLQPVFQISQTSSMTEDQSVAFKDAVITNTQPYGYWTNLDGGDAMYIDEITLLIWLLGFAALAACAVLTFKQAAEEDGHELFYQEE